MVRLIRAMTADFQGTFAVEPFEDAPPAPMSTKTDRPHPMIGGMGVSDSVFYRLRRQERRQGRAFAETVAASTIDGATRYLEETRQ